MCNNNCFCPVCERPPRAPCAPCAHRCSCREREFCPPAPRRATVTFRKVDSLTLLPLCGALFQLARGNCVISMAPSDACGNVTFHQLAPGQYRLTEVRSPRGYRSNPISYTLIVHEDGSSTIDGLSSCCFAIGNIRL